MTDSMYKIVIFGCGSLGANTTLTIARRLSDQVEFDLIDYDKIGHENLANQPWLDFNVGQKKVTVLRALLWHLAKSKAKAHVRKIENIADFRALKIGPANLLIDCFDNGASRRLTNKISETVRTSILHAGFSETGFLCSWDTEFQILGKSSVAREPICDRRELATIVQLGSSFAAEAAFQYLVNNRKRKYLFHLHDGNFSSY